MLSVAVLAEMSLRSPLQLFIFIIKNDDVMMYLFTTVLHPYGHRQLQELLGNQEGDHDCNTCPLVTTLLWPISFEDRQQLPAVLLFSKLNKIFFGYFDPENIFVDNKHK